MHKARRIIFVSGWIVFLLFAVYKLASIRIEREADMYAYNANGEIVWTTFQLLELDDPTAMFLMYATEDCDYCTQLIAALQTKYLNSEIKLAVLLLDVKKESIAKKYSEQWSLDPQYVAYNVQAPENLLAVPLTQLVVVNPTNNQWEIVADWPGPNVPDGVGEILKLLGVL